MRWIETICLIAVCQPVFAKEGNPLDISLISENRSIVPGQTFYVGLKLVHPMGFHTYWKHPGIVGVPTHVEWNLPSGFTAGEIEWPAPESVKMAIYDAQGFHGETLLMIPVTAPKELATGPVQLDAKVSWMCCGKECNPASKVPFSITLPVSKEAEVDPEVNELFAKFRAKIARPDESWAATAKKEAGGFSLHLSKLTQPVGELAALGEVRFFTEDGQVDSSGKQTVTLDSQGGVNFQLPGSEYGPENPSSLPGVVFASKGWGAPGPPFYIRIDPKY